MSTHLQKHGTVRSTASLYWDSHGIRKRTLTESYPQSTPQRYLQKNAQRHGSTHPFPQLTVKHIQLKSGAQSHHPKLFKMQPQPFNTLLKSEEA